MNVTRNNYEEYFLLYVDDELTDRQKQIVEAFIYANADLSEEFEMLKATKLNISPTPNFDKSFLYRSNENSINQENAEAFFLLQIDNELDENDQAALKIFLLQHPEKEKEFLLLQQAILPKEKIIFFNKKNLYRKKEDKRIIPFNWLKLSVAAAFIGVLVLVWFLIPGRGYQKTIAENHAMVNKNVPLILNKVNSSKQLIKQDILNGHSLASTIKNENNQVKKKNDNALFINKKATVSTKNNKQKAQLINNDFEKNKNQLPKSIVVSKLEKDSNNHIQIAAENNSANDISLTQITKQRLLDAQKKMDDVNKVFTATKQNENNIVQPAIYHTLNTDSDDKGLYVGSIELNKNKVRGFLKKATRFLGAKAKNSTGDGDLKVANLDINTKTL